MAGGDATASDERKEIHVLFMVIEHFNPGSAGEIYDRLRERGRGVPEGLGYVDSWIEAGFGRCFQLMECDDPRLLQEWVLHWHDLARFEIVPVVPSRDTAAVVERQRPITAPPLEDASPGKTS